jgi:hypothetical protein
MASPPGATRPASAHRNHVGEMVNTIRCCPEFEGTSLNRISRLVRAFVDAGHHERDLVSWVIAYADPTGETAVRNLMKAGAS